MAHIHCDAAHAGECYTCTLPVNPGERIVLLGRGYARRAGRYAHEGCWDWPEWSDLQNQNPCLTQAQVSTLLQAISRQKIPADDIGIQRLLGALRVARKGERRFQVATVSEVALVMGSELFAAYDRVLRIIGRERLVGGFWRPVAVNGSPWEDPREITATERRPWTRADEEVRRAAVQERIQQFSGLRSVEPAPMAPERAAAENPHQRMFELAATPGFRVIGAQIEPVMVGPSSEGQIWIRPQSDINGWRRAHPRQVFTDRSEAEADARSWQRRATGSR